MRVLKLLALAVFSLLILSNCKRIPVEALQNFTVITPSVEGARCRLTDNQNKQWYIPSTPGSVMLQRGDGPLVVICSKEGYKTATEIVPDESNILFREPGKLAGVMPQYPAKLVIYMEPRIWGSDAEKAEFELQKLLRERRQDEAKRQCHFSHFKNC